MKRVRVAAVRPRETRAGAVHSQTLRVARFAAQVLQARARDAERHGRRAVPIFDLIMFGVEPCHTLIARAVQAQSEGPLLAVVETPETKAHLRCDAQMTDVGDALRAD